MRGEARGKVAPFFVGAIVGLVIASLLNRSLSSFNPIQLTQPYVYDQEGGHQEADQQNMQGGARMSQSKNDSNYSWIGNQWIPPLGVPIYTAEDMNNFFQKENVLWIGDSTGRRAYATMFAIMNATSPSDLSLNDLNGPHIIDVNKGSIKEICTNRNYTNTSTSPIQWGPPETSANLCRQIQSAKQGYGKFDLGRKNCYKDILNFANMELKQPSLSQEYSIIVIALGVWETIRAWDCRVPNKTTEESLLLTLDALEKLSSPSLTVVWRTSGFPENMGDPRLVQLNAKTKERIQNATRQNSNMVLVDWGEGIYKRSFPPLRIKGDLKPHYGLEARTLMAQMLTHELISRSGI
jgi:hypothetical protein